MKTQRPNLLWIFLEDISPWMPLWGDTTVDTPNINALASRGMAFTEAYATAPVCSPSRSAMMLGMMQTTAGVHNHRDSRGRHQVHLPQPIRPLPVIFREHGYFSFNRGKDDYNFHYNRAELYDERNDWNARAKGQPFFGQIQLEGGKSPLIPAHPVARNTVTIPACYPEHPMIREEVARHYDRIQVVDEQVGRIVQRLQDDGLIDNTIIIFVGDHGMFLLRHKQFLYDGGIHVPLVIAAPGGHPAIQQGAIREELVSGIDVSVSSLALCGITVPEWMEGQNLIADDHVPRTHLIAARDRCDYTIDRIRAVRTHDYKYIRNFLTDRPYLQPQYRDSDARWGKPFTQVLKDLHAAGQMTREQATFYENHRPAEELYHLPSDPAELHNLANDPHHEQALLELRGTLNEWIEQTDDKGQYPESDEALLDVIDRGDCWGREAVGPEFDRLRRKDENQHA